MPSLEQEKSDVTVDPELAETICIQHAFGKTTRALAAIHGLPRHVIRRVITEYEQKQLKSRQQQSE